MGYFNKIWYTDCKYYAKAKTRISQMTPKRCGYGHVPMTRTRFGDRSFPAAGPRIWNSLQPELRRPDTELGEFRRSLKTFLFA